ncbi:MAG: carnitine dehydratase [Rhodospirillaceae bacterium]|nr:carnitine dehydratase [Rhodospirillaceae bacterium]
MTDSTSGQGPLTGIVVLDLTRVLAGPYCTMLLADLGARVIKIEPKTGDDSRQYGPWVNGRSAYFMSLNRGKESIALDLKNDSDRAVFEALLPQADVLVENYRPGTMTKLGYGWETLKERFPRLIYAASSGFGQTGPYARRPAYDLVVQGMGGIMSLTGHPGGPPTRVGTSVGDITAGLFTAIGINAALVERSRTGKGQMVDVAMLDCQLAILENAVARYFATGKAPAPTGARHPAIAPFEPFATSDGHVVIAAGNDALFRRACETLGMPELADDPMFATNDARFENVLALKARFEALLQGQTTDHWLALLEEAGIPCGPLNDVAQALNMEQTKARNMVVDIAGEEAGGLRTAGNPIKLSGHADPDFRGRAPDLDADRERILQALNLPTGQA